MTVNVKSCGCRLVFTDGIHDVYSRTRCDGTGHSADEALWSSITDLFAGKPPDNAEVEL